MPHDSGFANDAKTVAPERTCPDRPDSPAVQGLVGQTQQLVDCRGFFDEGGNSDGGGDAQLVAALGDGTQFWRLTAQRLLVEGRRTDAAPALKQAVTGGAPLKAIHALWTLHGLGQLDDATHRSALVHADAAVRRNAIRALGRDDRAVGLFFASAVVRELPKSGPSSIRLRDMGLLAGTRLTLVRTAPLGDPLEIKLRGYLLTLRRTEADHIVIDPAP